MPIEIKNKIAQVNSLIDAAFDAQKTSGYHLIIQLSIENVLLAVNEKEKDRFIAFENYTFQNVYDFNSLCDSLDTLIKQSALLPHTYNAVSCIIVNSISTLVPNPLFEEDYKKMFLRFNTNLEGNEYIEVDELKNLDAKNIFAIPFSIKTLLDKSFPNITYFHFSSALIESLLTQNKNQVKKKLYVHVQSSHLEVIVIEGKNLLFYNTFNHHSPEDFIYYLLFVCEQLQLNPESIETTFIGEIEKDSSIYSITQKYIRYLKFGERLDRSDFSYQLQKFPTWYYFIIFNNYFLQCG